MESIALSSTATPPLAPGGPGAPIVPGPAVVGAPAPPSRDASTAPTIVVPASPEGRAAGVLDPARRVVLADRLAALVRLADRPSGDAGSAPRLVIRAARGRLLDLEHALRSGVPVTRHGEHRVERLVDDAEAGAYASAALSALHDDAAAACAAVGSVTPFH